MMLSRYSHIQRKQGQIRVKLQHISSSQQRQPALAPFPTAYTRWHARVAVHTPHKTINRANQIVTWRPPCPRDVLSFHVLTSQNKTTTVTKQLFIFSGQWDSRKWSLPLTCTTHDKQPHQVNQRCVTSCVPYWFSTRCIILKKNWITRVLYVTGDNCFYSNLAYTPVGLYVYIAQVFAANNLMLPTEFIIMVQHCCRSHHS